MFSISKIVASYIAVILLSSPAISMSDPMFRSEGELSRLVSITNKLKNMVYVSLKQCSTDGTCEKILGLRPITRDTQNVVLKGFTVKFELPEVEEGHYLQLVIKDSSDDKIISCPEIKGTDEKEEKNKIYTVKKKTKLLPVPHKVRVCKKGQ